MEKIFHLAPFPYSPSAIIEEFGRPKDECRRLALGRIFKDMPEFKSEAQERGFWATSDSAGIISTQKNIQTVFIDFAV